MKGSMEVHSTGEVDVCTEDLAGPCAREPSMIGGAEWEVGARFVPAFISLFENIVGSRGRYCIGIGDLGGLAMELKDGWGWFGDQSEEEAVRNGAKTAMRINGEREEDCVGFIEGTDHKFSICVGTGRVDSWTIELLPLCLLVMFDDGYRIGRVTTRRRGKRSNDRNINRRPRKRRKGR